MCTDPVAGRQRGISLAELLMFIVIVGVGVAGILSVLNQTAARSADPLPVKQAYAIAEALLEEVQLAAFTLCDPTDPNVLTAPPCGAVGPPSRQVGESRPWDNVIEYEPTVIGPGITDITGAPIGGLGAYSATINVAASGLGSVPAGAALLITVTVTGPGGTNVSLSGYRTRYAPNSIP
jgi:MSHA pilin protein MshD